MFNKNKERPPEKTRSQKLALALTVGALLFYPFILAGFPLFVVVQYLDKRDQENHIEDMDYESFLKRWTVPFGLASFLLFVLNILIFISVLPRGYLSTYLFFPLKYFNTTLVFNHETVLALIIGSLPMTSLLLTFNSFTQKRKVKSKSEQRRELKGSKAYKKRLENKFILAKEEAKRYDQEFEEAKAANDIKALEELKKSIYMGTDEWGKPYRIPLAEFNQHAFFAATTGGGKTTALELMIEHCAKFDIPCLVLDGKGARDTFKAAQDISKLYGKDVVDFSDRGEVSINPVKYGNSTMIKDKMYELAKTESVYYSGTSELLTMGTIQVIDHFNVPRLFKNFSKYLLPRNVLTLFANEVLPLNPDLFTFVVEPKKQKKKKKTKKEEKKDADISQLDEDVQQLEDEVVAHEEPETVTLDPETMLLDDFYYILNRAKYLMCDRSVELFEQLFTRYEHKKSVFYLYATSENLQTQMNILTDSDIGHLFDTEENPNEFDLMEIVRKGELAYVSLDGLVYTKFIKTLAQFIISDINYLASERYEISESFPFMVLFDEPSSYLTEAFIDTVNKTRGAGVHAVFSPQTLADIDKIDPVIKRQLIGNVNTYFVGQTNEPTEIDYWLKLFGTYDDIEITTVTEQQQGYSDVSKADWVGEKGTQRNVENFNVRGQDIRDLRTGEFYVYRKGANSREPIRKVYLRKVS